MAAADPTSIRNDGPAQKPRAEVAISARGVQKASGSTVALGGLGPVPNLIPSERRAAGVAEDLTVRENIFMRPNRRALEPIVSTSVRDRSYELMRWFGVQPPNPQHVVSTIIVGIGGTLYGANLGSAGNSTESTLLLPAFAGAFLGPTAIFPGRPNVLGMAVAVLLLAAAISALEQVGVEAWVQSLIDSAVEVPEVIEAT